MADIYGSYFEYGGVRSTDYNLIISNVDTDRVTQLAGDIEGSTIFNRAEIKRYLIDDDYSGSPLYFDVEITTPDGSTIPFQERRQIEQWLFNRHNYRKFYVDLVENPPDEVYETEESVFTVVPTTTLNSTHGYGTGYYLPGATFDWDTSTVEHTSRYRLYVDGKRQADLIPYETTYDETQKVWLSEKALIDDPNNAKASDAWLVTHITSPSSATVIYPPDGAGLVNKTIQINLVSDEYGEMFNVDTSKAYTTWLKSRANSTHYPGRYRYQDYSLPPTFAFDMNERYMLVVGDNKPIFFRPFQITYLEPYFNSPTEVTYVWIASDSRCGDGDWIVTRQYSYEDSRYYIYFYPPMIGPQSTATRNAMDAMYLNKPVRLYKINKFYLNCRLINAERLEYYNGIVGYRGTLESDSNMWWQDENTQTFNINNASSSTITPITVSVDSDLDDYIYPQITITTGDSTSDVSLWNTSDDSSRLTTFNNISAGTTIVIKGGVNYLSPASAYNSFYNKNFPRLINGNNIINVEGLVNSVSVTFNNRRNL